MRKTKAKKDELSKKIIYEPEEESISFDLEKKLKKIKEELKKCQKEKIQYLTGWQRAQADLINYRRRQEEKENQLKLILQEQLITDLLPVLDTLDLASRQNQEIKPIQDQILQILASYGLKPMQSLGQKFDPHLHEAVDRVKSNKEEGTILEEIQRGYFLGEKVLRPAKVRVAGK